MAKMRILNLGHNGVNQRARNCELQALGLEVLTESLYAPGEIPLERAARRLAEKTHQGIWIDAVNRSLVERAAAWRAFDVIWFDKALFVYPETLKIIRARTGARLVHFTPDMHFRIRAASQKSSFFLRGLQLYDAVITTKEFEVAEYVKSGARGVVLTEQIVSDKLFYPRNFPGDAYLTEVGFVGRAEPYYRSVLRRIWRAGVPLSVRGHGWEKLRHRLDPRNSGFVKGGPIVGPEYPEYLSATKIGLGLLTKLGPEVSTTRTFEIPACATFLLAERTARHQELYREGMEAEFFSSVDELVDKARFYLSNSMARDRVRQAGYWRFQTGPFRGDRVVSRLMRDLKEVLYG